MNNPPTETEVRTLRDRVFGKPITDNEWSTCRAHWMAPSQVAWLISHDFPISEAYQRWQANKAMADSAVKKVC